MSSKEQMDRIVEGLPTKSARIRALHEAGYSRSDIARFLDIRYQHVRNVLVQPPPRNAPGLSEAPQRSIEEAQPLKVRVGPGGRIVVPASFREALGIEEGDTMILSLEDGDIRAMTIDGAIRRAQAIVRRFVPEGVSLADELIADRRREAQKESDG